MDAVFNQSLYGKLATANTWTAAQTFNTGTTIIGTADINGGAIDATVIGGTTPAAVSCTTLTASGNLTATGSDFTISTNTSDGSDNKRIFVTAGGGVAASRGAAFQMYGNEFPSLGGNMYFDAGEAGSIYFRYGASNTTGFSLGATGITTFAGATPGTPSAGQVLIGGGIAAAATGFQVGANQVVGAQGAAVADASAVSGTATSGGYGFTDATEFNSFVSGVNALKDQLNALLSRVRAHGLIAT